MKNTLLRATAVAATTAALLSGVGVGVATAAPAQQSETAVLSAPAHPCPWYKRWTFQCQGY